MNCEDPKYSLLYNSDTRSNWRAANRSRESRLTAVEFVGPVSTCIVSITDVRRVNTAISVGASHHVRPVARYTRNIHIELTSWHLTQQVFLPRDAMPARYLLLSCVRLPVRVTSRYWMYRVNFWRGGFRQPSLLCGVRKFRYLQNWILPLGLCPILRT